ncbi:MAG: type IV toxin-antitoxin system AbiEi family antitoxin domain-containing protein [Corynebacterium humireducens]|jgi:predicted transcriptional regulator of viral defense system|uniref:Type IV toxin-antitoxin system AbiEi family antitoxin domain-containing protein n=1 Tax=Corynebacterium humireducens TaxID=1223514 RepID=A0A7X6SVG4_9CORY|nr:type IV toxin-antitoxin system AbiEi family antitoxin domain-containing protein [Corynebacterium humireducens]
MHPVAKYPHLGETSNLILASVTGPTTPAEVADRTGLPTKKIADYLARHARAGIIRRIHRGVYAPTNPTN